MTITERLYKRDGSVEVYVDGELFAVCAADALERAGFRDERELTEQRAQELRALGARYAAYQSALRTLACTDCSAALLARRLRGKGIDGEMADFAVAECARRGYLSDEGFAAKIVRCYSGEKCLGRRRVREELLRRGIDRALAEDLLETEAAPDSELIWRYYEKKFAKNPPRGEKMRKKCADALARAGFLWEDIRDVLAAVQDEEELPEEDISL